METNSAKSIRASSPAKAAALALTAGLALTGCQSNPGGGSGAASEEEASFSGEEVRIIVPTSAGGGVDTAARQLQPYLEEQLDATIVVENIPGGGTALGNTAALQAENCSAVLLTAIPHLMISYITQEVDYDLSSFAAVGGLSVEPGVIRVAKDAKWNSFEELIEDAKAKPGEISVSVSEPTSSNYLGINQIEEQAGVDFNVVPFDGGGPSRLAVVSGEADAVHAGVFNSLSIAEDSKVLAVQQDENRWPDITDNAPTVGEVIGDVPDNESTYNLWTSAQCKNDHPERYQLLTDSIEPVLTSEGYVADLEELGEESKVDYREPAQVEADAKEAEESIRGLMDAQPEVFNAG